MAPAARLLLSELARTHGLPPVPLASGARTGFRLRARLALRGHVGSPKVGIFARDSHRVVHIPNCLVHHPLINRAASVVLRALAETRMTLYSERAHLGVARYLQVVIERRSQTAQLVLVGNSPNSEPAAACLKLIQERLGAELHSLWFSANCDSSNTILGATFEHRQGPPTVVERFGGGDIHYPPGAFGQSNPDLAQRIIEQVRRALPQDSKVVELYAGVGAIGLSVLSQVREMRLNEMSPSSLQGLELGIASLDPAERSKVTVLPGAAAPEHLGQADVVIVDPPRRGLDPALADHLAEQPPERLLYISCDPRSLLDDTERLEGKGRLRLVELNSFDLFPYTEHIETLARFERP
jgi:23S rRNA (uracil1939-C5)-methyltransferase